MAKSKKKKEATAHKSTATSASKKTSNKTKTKAKTKTKTKNRKRSSNKNRTGNASTFAPFNIQPMNRKQQSRQDKAKELRAKGFSGDVARKMVKSGKKVKQLLKGAFGNQATNNKTFKLGAGFKGKARSGPGAGFHKGGWKKNPVKLPLHVPKACNTPWYNEKVATATSSNFHEENGKNNGNGKKKHSTKQKKNQVLPPSYYSISKSTLSSFQEEIDNFVEYIRLTPHEVTARKDFIQNITQLSHELWHEDVEIDIFGSFATPDVCTFQSDVDLALWNVVPSDADLDRTRNNHKRNFSSDSDSEPAEEYTFGGLSGISMSESSLLRTMQALKTDQQNAARGKDKNGGTKTNKNKATMEERVGEWKKALEEEELAKASSSSPSPSSSPSKPAPQTGGKDDGFADEKKFSEDPPEYGFIIDRTGVGVQEEEYDDDDDVEDKSEELAKQISSPLSPSLKKEAKESGVDDKKSNGDTPESGFIIDRTGMGVQQEGEAIVLDAESSNEDEKRAKEEEDVIILDAEGSDDDEKGAEEKDDNVIVLDAEDSDDHDEESVDKMDAFHRRTHANELGLSMPFSHQKKRKSDDTHTKLSTSEPVSKRTRSHDPTKNNFSTIHNNSHTEWSSGDSSCYDDGSDSDDGQNDTSGFELNISNHNNQSQRMKPIGPTGKVRDKVVKALSLMGRNLRRSPFVQSIEVRRRARVPIVVVTTKFGFDTDVALAGHTGTDTSHYVRKLVKKFDGFATVVLFLKVLLQQADLDKPFTGGLGSYKLYVLVASHFNMHSALGGGETTAELLLSFFFRYSTPSKSSNKGRTYLCKSYTISSEGGDADLSPVSVDHCVDLFRLCFQTIMNSLEQHGTNDKSLVASLIDMMQVKRERTVVLNQAKSYYPLPPTIIPHDHPGKITPGSRITHTFFKSGGRKNMSDSPPKVGKKKSEGVETKKLTRREKRSARGALIPKRRFDIEMKLDGMDAILQRGAKRRKNKKKQNRDAALTEFVMRTIS